MWDACLDLLFGSTCVVCSAPGRALCRTCRARLPQGAAAAWPTPAPEGLVRPAAAGEYAGALRTMVLAHKEQGRLALARPLGDLLALAVIDTWRAAAAAGRPPPGCGSVRVDLVPVPSHRAVVREREQDPVTRMGRAAAARLRRSGFDARLCPALRVRVRAADQAGLGASARARNLHNRFEARPRGPATVAEVVLVDDVITTGATLREAQRALEAAGVVPIGSAVVAATRRRIPARR